MHLFLTSSAYSVNCTSSPKLVESSILVLELFKLDIQHAKLLKMFTTLFALEEKNLWASGSCRHSWTTNPFVIPPSQTSHWTIQILNREKAATQWVVGIGKGDGIRGWWMHNAWMCSAGKYLPVTVSEILSKFGVSDVQLKKFKDQSETKLKVWGSMWNLPSLSIDLYF